MKMQKLAGFQRVFCCNVPQNVLAFQKVCYYYAMQLRGRSDLRLLAVPDADLFWSKVESFFEQPVEVGDILETAIHSYSRNAVVSVEEHCPCLFETDVIEIF